ncbi:MAG TPA: biotin/lipoyl-binding protein, partial [Chloroflexota bacterium]|nr:biotin/lipoyl-binding protein [Chloroflexota bacterium]
MNRLTKASAFAGLALVLAGCGVPPQQAVASATVKRGDLVQTVSASGTTVTPTQAKLSFTVSGKLAKIDVSAGDQVAAGQVLAEIDPSDLQSALQQTQSAKQAAEAAVAGAQAKVQQLLASAKPENIAQAKAAADAARQKLQLAQNGARPEQIQQAQAAVQAAQAKLQAL